VDATDAVRAAARAPAPPSGAVVTRGRALAPRRLRRT